MPFKEGADACQPAGMAHSKFSHYPVMKKFLSALFVVFSLSALMAGAEEKIAPATHARVWLQVPEDAPPLRVAAADGTVTQASWLSSAEKNARLADVQFPISGQEWREAEITFTPESDTVVTLSLLGPWDPAGARKEVLYDALRLQGAKLENPGFENVEDGRWRGWRNGHFSPNTWPLQGEKALEGKRLVSAWNNRPLSQDFAVQAGRTVTLRVAAKAAVPPGYVFPKRLGANTPAHRALREIRRGVNFGNCWEVPPPYSWRVPHSVEDVERAHAEGFDHIRIPVAWHHHFKERDGRRVIDEALLAELDPVIDRALAKGMHVLLNWHHYDALTKDPDRHQADFVAGWKIIADHYRKHSSALWFELLNEPHDALTTERANPLYAEAIKAIRESNAERILVASPGRWGSIEELENLRLPDDDDRIIVTVHNYAPFPFTHQGASWTGMQALKGVRYPGPPTEPLELPASLQGRGDLVSFAREYNTRPAGENPCSKKALRKHFSSAVRWSKTYGRPVHLGEFGAIILARLEDRNRYARDVRELAEENGIPWTLWDWKAMFAYWDKEQGKPLLREGLFGKK